MTNNTAEIIFEEIPGSDAKKLGVITLNRPQAFNALNFSMIQTLQRQLSIWAQQTDIKAVVIKSDHEKAFCAGGDIREICNYKQQHDTPFLQFFREEYQLNYFIANYPKPYIALLNGIAMGGGLGISLHGRYRIADTTLKLAMPETGIGFFPDIGGSYFLSRCPGGIGYYLGLTGNIINISDALYAKLVDYPIPRDKHAELITALANQNSSDEINKLLNQFAQPAPQTSLLETMRTHIDHHFLQPDLQTIITSLEQCSENGCQTAAATLLKKSPTSLSVTLQQLQKAQHLTLKECFKMEFRMVHRFVQGHDFYEGVRAVIIDKDQKPNWQPAHFALLEKNQVDSYFLPVAAELELSA